ncbi:KRAB-A domain-containing protein 2-like [Solenopsis invicta]|uniref:KRAB-A domain-containing protein 2-like n=1 Tax=Solenopsis invicta TaxID=13686 RepID=UPI00193EB53D|nr:KRAB-A domain-containing protein 2-like [Solenopsis invicta]
MCSDVLSAQTLAMSDKMECENLSRKSWKLRFLEELLTLERKESHYNVMKRDEYDKLLAESEEAKAAIKKTPLQYRRVKRFDVFEIGGTKKLISKDEPVKYYLPAEEIYDVIESAHIAVRHGGRDRMKKETSRKYANITNEMINIFLSMCETCQQKRSKRKKGLVSKPILHSEMNSRCQVDLIDMQSQADEQFKFIMVYQDHLTKFILLRALQSKRAEEVALQLTDIFLTFGAPCILYSDNGREFVNSVIEELFTYWPELKIVHGKPRHSQSQGSVERANQDIENMLASWLKDNNTTKWLNGFKFVQFMKNRALHFGIKQSPYKAMFGIEPRVGLTTSSLPSDMITNIHDENDLQNIIEQMNTEHEETEIVEEVQEDEAEAMLTTISSNISLARKEAKENLEKQAKRMQLISDATHSPVDIGANIIIPIPDVDRRKADLRNLIGIVLERNEDGLYKIGTKDGILNKLYCRSEFDISPQIFLTQEQVPKQEISLRTAARKGAVGTGQGFVRCACTKNCTSKRCFCMKKGNLCNSKCHNSMPCKNK